MALHSQVWKAPLKGGDFVLKCIHAWTFGKREYSAVYLEVWYRKDRSEGIFKYVSWF